MTNSTVNIPENIDGVKAINSAITDAVTNPSKYENLSYLPDNWESNYNCFQSTLSISKGESPINRDAMSPIDFSNSLKKDYDTANPSEYKFANTSIRFGKDEKNVLGMSSNFSTHSATYLGTSKNGTIHTWSKNGTVSGPGIVPLKTLESLYGKNQGFGPTKNETGFYNRR